MSGRQHLFRVRDRHGHAPVTNIELFFDLVFVFAVTQLSHRLLSHLTPIGAIETLLLFLAIWWVWIYTSWTTNWLDPERAHVRLMLIALMVGGLVLSSVVPDAFGQTGLLFAIAYVAMQIGRTLYMVWAWHDVDTAGKRNFIRIVFYFLMSAPLWIWGALVDGEMRLALWAAAVAIEYAGPVMLFRMPVLGHSSTADWDISGAHMAERCSLFIIISLGEAVLVTGATFAELPHDAVTWTAFVISFLGSALMWWIYFDVGAKRGAEMISGSGNAGLVARNAYTYLHMPIVAGIVVTAVADEKVLAHPHGHIEPSFLWTSIGGAALFLIGNMFFKRATSGRPWLPLSHNVGLAALAGVAAWGAFGHQEPLTIAIATNGALLLVAIWEWGSFHGGWLERGMPVPQWIIRRAAERRREQEEREKNSVA